MTDIPHQPVLLEETVSHLITDPSGTYIDGTIGFAGHSTAILQNLNNTGKLIGIDADPYALEFSEKRLCDFKTQISLHNENFQNFPKVLNEMEIQSVNGILLDIGVSSYQVDAKHRGFSFQTEAPLDMRFNPNKGMSARDLLYQLNEQELSVLIRDYGEERYHKKIASAIVTQVNSGTMETTLDLRNAIATVIYDRFLVKSLSRVFQAIRIEVNQELESLKTALHHTLTYVKKGGRIAVITFHSLEDKIVKRFFQAHSKDCVCPKEYPVCVCETVPLLRMIKRKAIVSSKSELAQNPRARSAKLRVAERV